MNTIGSEDIRYRHGKRLTFRLVEFHPDKDTRDGDGDVKSIPFKQGGVYLITGGGGGLGLAVSEQIVNRVRAKVVLTGRSVLNKEQEERITAM